MTSSNMAFSHIDVKKTQFTWKIDNFSSISTTLAVRHKLDSPNFTVKQDDNIKWHLSAWPNGFNTSENNNFLLNDVLTIYCELTVVYKDNMENIDEAIQQLPVCVDKKLSSAFEKQLEKEEFSDVKLVASCGKELQAHKFVLAARSPVFSAMFTNDMKEKNTNSIVIQDLDYNTLKEMLRFLYAGRIENLGKVADGILAAQEKYQIEGLKKLCEEHFFQNINIENVIDTLVFSIRYNLDKTNILAKKFIRCHAKDVSNSTAFKSIDEPKLLVEIVNILADLS